MPPWRDKLETFMRRLASGAKAKFSADSRVITVKNDDDTVDSEIRIIVPHGTHERSILAWLSDYTIGITPKERISPKIEGTNRTNPKANIWMAVGGRYEPDTISDEFRDQYVIHWGMLEIATYYRRTFYRGEHFSDAIATVDEMRAKWARKAREVVIRMRYEPHSTTRPDRKGHSAPRKLKR